MHPNALGIGIPAAHRTNQQSEFRRAFAKRIRSLRRLQRSSQIRDTKLNEKRDRPLSEYNLYLAGLEATLEYINCLPVRLVVDMGMGTGRAFATLSRIPKHYRVRFMGVDMMRSSDAILNDCRLTPAEIMRGFQPQSIGAAFSVFGPTHYTRIDPVFERLNKLLVWGGLIKVVIMKHIHGSSLNGENARQNREMERFFRRNRYDYAYCDGGHTNRKGVFRIYLAIKRRYGSRGGVRALDLLIADRRLVKRYAPKYVPR